MQITRKNLSDTTVQLTIVADETQLQNIKATVLKQLSKDVKLQGFRPGKAPAAMVEKAINQETLQSEFISEAVNRLYFEASEQEKLRAATQPKVDIKKFVPFTTLEIEVTVDVVGDVKLGDYKSLKTTKKAIKIADKDVDAVLENLKNREAEKKDVARAVKDGDEATIDFAGVDAKTKEAIAGTEGKDYPLGIGSGSFIPGFEPEIIGMKIGDEKTFDIVFPKDYGVSALQNRKVAFTVKVTKVQELVKPDINDEFAAKVGPFKNVAELKADIKKQLTAEQENQTQREFENELIEEIIEHTTVAIPELLIEEQLTAMEDEERQNLTYRGQSWEQHLEQEGVTEKEHREKNRDTATKRVKAGIVLSEIAEIEKINVSPEELDIRMQILKGQYKDAQMQAELDKPEGRRSILSRMVTEKTIAKIISYNAKKK